MTAIDQALRAKRWPTQHGLARELDVDPRTIRRDLEFMRDQLCAPIAFDRARRGYCYTEPTFRLPSMLVTDGELLALFLAERIMGQFKGTPFEPALRRAIEKLGELLPEHASVRLENVTDFLSVLPKTECAYDPKTFMALVSAITKRRQLEVHYWAASHDETLWRTVDLYGLSLGDEGWYAIGHCHLRKAIRMFAIQRIQSLRETGASFDRPEGFRVEDYQKGSFRAYPGDGDYHVVLRFKPGVARRFAEKKWHASQILDPQDDGSLLARMHLSSLVEVKRWVMWWGTDCEVLEPSELRELVATEVHAMLPRLSASGDAGRALDDRVATSNGRGANQATEAGGRGARCNGAETGNAKRPKGGVRQRRA
jgi:predicted DNA-binding transcriptional regulator YafY